MLTSLARTFSFAVSSGSGVRRAALASALALAGALSAGACANEAPSTDTGDVTDIKNTSVKNQAIGNCWVYATVGWAESLHFGHSGEQLDISESYISYWHWFEQITEGAGGRPAITRMDSTKNELTTGGWFGLAAELMLRYGVLAEGSFIPEEAESARSSRQSAALRAINESLKTGALMERTARRNAELVRAELDKAWGLKPEVVALLDEVFGKEVDRTLLDDVEIPENSGLLRVGDIEVGENAQGGAPLTLADAIGRPASSTNVLSRVGEFAWNEVKYPSATSGSARREFLRRAQQALHAGQPVIMTWLVDFNAMKSGVFAAPPETPGRQGGHMTVLEDYEIDNVPGYGTLKAGETVTDPKALEAALADEATIKFFRIKNSWGSDLAPQEAGDEFRGYHDLFMTYLDGPIDECVAEGTDKCARKTQSVPLRALVLPPKNFASAGAGAAGTCHAVCEEGPALDASCGECAAAVCEADPYCCEPKSGAWDEQCVREVAEHCSAGCN